MALDLEIDKLAPDLVVARLDGDLDAQTSPVADRQLDAACAGLPPGSTFVFDLAGLDYISSAGLRTIFRVRKGLKTNGGQAVVKSPQPQVRKVFDIVKAIPVSEVFDIVKAIPVSEVFASDAELDAYLDTMQRRTLEQLEDDDGF